MKKILYAAIGTVNLALFAGCAGFGGGVSDGLAGQAGPPGSLNPFQNPGHFFGWLVGTAVTVGLPILMHGKMTSPIDGAPAAPPKV